MDPAKKKYLIIGAIVIVIVIGFVIFAFMGKSSNDTKSTDNKNSSSTTKSTTSGKDDTAGLKIEDSKVGSGAEVKVGDMITFNYVGTLENGTKFDSSYDRKVPLETKIGVGQQIKGLDKGLIGMKVGGKRKLTVPAALGFGAQGAGSKVPPNSNLIFEVELVGIK